MAESRATKGIVTGVLRPGGYILAVDPGRPKSDLEKRVDALVEELAAKIEAGKTALQEGGLKELSRRIYSTAGEVADAAAGKAVP